ncbi:hypothetical protein ACFV2X_25335 [Streptomyces sp. NPDC059679]|uniref:hypothetical protein n=1 Tax=Streptomyces sp. NPDC059679 TaxID=3346903 RepID=UPI003675E61C
MATVYSVVRTHGASAGLLQGAHVGRWLDARRDEAGEEDEFFGESDALTRSLCRALGHESQNAAGGVPGVGQFQDRDGGIDTEIAYENALFEPSTTLPKAA